MNRIDQLNRWSLLAPVAALAIVLIFAVIQFLRIGLVQRQLSVAERELQELTARSLIPEATSKEIPNSQLVPDEQSRFLDSLTETAKQHGVQLVNLTSVPPRVVDPNAESPYPKDVRPLGMQIEVRGDYNAVRRFMYSITDTDRLITISEMTWRPYERTGLTSLSFILTRYIEDGAPPADAPKRDMRENFLENISQ